MVSGLPTEPPMTKPLDQAALETSDGVHQRHQPGGVDSLKPATAVLKRPP
jgi:hypothetical protein